MVAAAPLALVAGGLGVAGSLFSTIQGINQAKFEQKVAEREVAIAKQNQTRASEETQQTMEQQGEAARAQIGDMISTMAASGIDLGFGSSLINLEQTRALAQRDFVRIGEEGRQVIANAKEDELAAQMRADSAKSKKTTALIGGILNVGSSLIGTASGYKSAQFLDERLASLKQLKTAPASREWGYL